MSSEALAKNMLAPLILRLAAAAVLLYHGHSKILDPKNNWGAEWVDNTWEQQKKMPDDVSKKLDDMSHDEKMKDKVDDVRAKLEFKYAEERKPIPEVIQFKAVQFAVAWGEVVGGIALLVGFLTRLAALGEIIIQLGAIYTVTWYKGFSFAEGGYEFNLVLLAILLALVLTGGGTLSLDALLFKKKE